MKSVLDFNYHKYAVSWNVKKSLAILVLMCFYFIQTPCTN